MALGLTPQALGQIQTVTQPFTWGGNGRRRTPEQLAAERQMAEQMLAAGSDASPVGHWTQGLARLSQGLLGGMRLADAREAEAENTQYGDTIAQALLAGGGGQDAIAQALIDPNTPKAVRDFAELRYRTENRAPPQPSEFERALEASGIMPGTPQWAEAMAKRRDNLLDPIASVPLPGGQVYLGPRSGLSSVLGGEPKAAPPDKLPSDFDFGKGGATPSASGNFR